MKVIQRHAKRYFALKRLQEECNVRLKSDTSVEQFFDETFPDENSALKDKAPLIFPTSSLPLSFSPAETATSRHLGFHSSLASRAGAVGSWFEPLEKTPDQFSLQNYIWAPCIAISGQMTINVTRGHVSPLAMLMCNFSLAKPRVDNADFHPAKPRGNDADKLSLTMLSVNKSLKIISRRDIEKVTCLYEPFFVQAEQCLGFIRKAYPLLFLFGKSGEQGAGMQLGPPSCIQNRVLRSFRTSLYCKFLLKTFQISFRFTGFVVIGRVKVKSQSVYLRDIYHS